MMCLMTCLLKHIMMSVMDQQSPREVTDDFFGSGMMLVVLKHVRTMVVLREILKLIEVICQLVCTSSEHTTRNVVWQPSMV